MTLAIDKWSGATRGQTTTIDCGDPAYIVLLTSKGYVTVLRASVRLERMEDD